MKTIIFTSKCNTCGVIGSCHNDQAENAICRVCDPEGWTQTAEIEKQMWLSGHISNEIKEASK